MLILLFLSAAGGCDWFNWRKPAPAPERGSVREAEDFVHGFMTDRINGRPEQTLNNYLSDTAREDYRQSKLLVLRGVSNPRLSGYHIKSRARINSAAFLITAAVQSNYQNLTYANNTMEDLEVGYFDGKYLITRARAKDRREVFAKAGRVRYADEQGTEKDVLTMVDLPDEAVPQGGSPDQRFGVGKSGFESLALSADNSLMAFSTTGVHGFVGYADFVSRKVQKLDLIFEGKAVDLIWSPQGDYLAAEIAQPMGTNGIKVYRLEGRKMLSLGLTAQFPPDKFELTLGRWSDQEKVLFFNADAVTGAEKEPGVEGKTGRWKIDVETKDLTRISVSPGA